MMKSILLLITGFLLFTFIPHGNETKVYGSDSVDTKRYERYRYEAVRLGKHEANQKESILIEINKIGRETLLNVQTQRLHNDETLRLTLDQKGEVISGVREIDYHSRKQIHQERIWRIDQTVYVKHLLRGRVRTKSFIIPKPVPLVIDASLIYLLRSFPYGKNTALDYYMVDFSQVAVTVTARQTGIETVTVPAGEFDCYHIEVLVNSLTLLPKIHFWLTKDPPHFLVKHSGKRGPFSPNYISTLVSYNW